MSQGLSSNFHIMISGIVIPVKVTLPSTGNYRQSGPLRSPLFLPPTVTTRKEEIPTMTAIVPSRRKETGVTSNLTARAIPSQMKWKTVFSVMEVHFFLILTIRSIILNDLVKYALTVRRSSSIAVYLNIQEVLASAYMEIPPR